MKNDLSAQTDDGSKRNNESYPFAQFFHLASMTSGDGTLVVTQNGHLAVCVVVSLDLLGNVTRGLDLLEQLAHGVRSVVCTENLGGKARHVILEVLVQSRSLD